MEKSATCMPGRYTKLFTGFGSSVNFGVSCGLQLRAAAAGPKCPFPLLGVTRFLLAARRTLSFTHAVATSSPLFWVPLSALQHLCRIQILLGKAPETRVQLTIRGQKHLPCALLLLSPHALHLCFRAVVIFSRCFRQKLPCFFPLHPTSRLPATAPIAT